MKVILCVPGGCRYFLNSKWLSGPVRVQRCVVRFFVTLGSFSAAIARAVKIWSRILHEFRNSTFLKSRFWETFTGTHFSAKIELAVGKTIGTRRWKAETLLFEVTRTIKYVHTSGTLYAPTCTHQTQEISKFTIFIIYVWCAWCVQILPVFLELLQLLRVDKILKN